MAQETPEHFSSFFVRAFLGVNHKSAQTLQSLLSVPCKRSSAAPISFGFRLSVARSHRTALQVVAQSAPCGFVPLANLFRNYLVCKVVCSKRLPNHVIKKSFRAYNTTNVRVLSFIVDATGFEPAVCASLRSAQDRGPPDLVSPLRPNAVHSIR